MAVRAVERRMVWDLPVRVVHWTLVLAIIGSWTTNRLGPIYFKWHVVCGCTVIVLVTFRILWGFVGTRHARFGSFVRGPRAVGAYLRGSRAMQAISPGHNPLGAISVVLMLLLLLTQGLTGLFANDAVANTGPLYGWVSGSTSDLLTTIHHRVFFVLELLIPLHIAAVLFYAFVKRTRLIAAMFSGYKPAEQVPPGHEISGSRLLTALILVVAIGGLLLVILRLAPPAGLPSF
ncbi:MAG TPA: cytochrome b/b6 domain-containing protein [Steroidobacteraceae bacterium]|nr:cytochrome b/b6 domain-containing protein [Steroidobacteraceae bacterium]